MPRRPRLLVLTAAYPSRSAPHRATFVQVLVEALRREAHVRVLAPRVFRADPAREVVSGVPVVRFPFLTEGHILKRVRRPGPGLLLSYLASGTAAAIALTRRRRMDALLVHWVLPTGPIGRLAAAATGRPYLLFAHGSDVNDYAARPGPLRAAAGFALGGASHVFAASADLRRRIGALFPSAPAAEVLRGPVPESFRHPPDRAEARHRLGLPPKARIALYVGDLTHAKGADLLAGAARAWSSDWTFLALGEGPEAARLRADGVRVLDPVPHPEVLPWLAAADVLLHPSRSEGTPVSVLEALAVGLPIVASRVGGIPEVIRDGVEGLLFEPADPAPLLAAGRTLTPARLARLAEGARLAGGRDLASNAAARVLEVARAPIVGDAARRSARARERAEVAWDLTSKREGRSLDAGTGRGEAAALLAALGMDVTALDRVPPPAIAGVRTIRADLETDRLPEGPFDLILCLEVLEHLVDPEATLAALAARLADEGELVLSLPNEGSLAGPGGARHRHTFAPGDADRLLRRAGLIPVARRTIPVVPPRWGRTLRVIGGLLATRWPTRMVLAEAVCARRPAPGAPVDLAGHPVVGPAEAARMP